MNKLAREQKIAIADFLGNFAVAWLAAGLVIPILEESFSKEKLLNVITAIYWASVLLILMLYLTKKTKK